MGKMAEIVTYKREKGIKPLHHPIGPSTPPYAFCEPTIPVGPHAISAQSLFRATSALAWVRVVLPRGLVCHVASARVPRHIFAFLI